MSSLCDVTIIFENKGYKEIFNEVGMQIYYKCEPKIGPKCIVVVDSMVYPHSNDDTIDLIKEKAMRHQVGMQKSQILVVMMGYLEHCLADQSNFILFNPDTAKITICRVEDYFKPEKEMVKNAAKRKQAYTQKMNADFEMAVYEKDYVPIVTWLLIAVNIVVYIKTLLDGAYTYGISTEKVLYYGESYRLVSYMFLHGSFLHLISNSIALLYIGNNVIKRTGNINFLITYLCGGIFAGLVSVYAGSIGIKTAQSITVGASGAIFAALGALFIDTLTDSTGDNRKIISYCVMVLITSSISPTVDVPCHIGGFISGILLMALLKTSDETAYLKKYVKASRKQKRIEDA